MLLATAAGPPGLPRPQFNHHHYPCAQNARSTRKTSSCCCRCFAWREENPPFVELGAFRGIELSNTYMYERCFGWSGVLIEGNP